MSGTAVMTIVGDLSKDGDLKYTPEGLAVLTLSVPVSKGKDKPTTWYNIVKVGKQVENEKFVALFKKGAGIFAAGPFEVKEYEKRDGGKGVSYTVYASELSITKYAPKAESSDSTEEPF